MNTLKYIIISFMFCGYFSCMAATDEQSGADYCNKISTAEQGQLAIYHASLGYAENLNALLKSGCFDKIKKDTSAIEEAAISVGSIDAFLFFNKNFNIDYQRLKVWKKTFGAFILKQSENPIDIGSDKSLVNLVKSSSVAIPKLGEGAIIRQGDRQKLIVAFFKEMSDIYLGERDYNGNSYLHIAFKFGLDDVAEIIAKRSPELMQAKNKDGVPAFFYDKKMAYEKQYGLNLEKKYLIANVMLLNAIQYGIYTKAEFINRLDKKVIAEQNKGLEVILKNKTSEMVIKNTSFLDIR
jgi:hypothetical protein